MEVVVSKNGGVKSPKTQLNQGSWNCLLGRQERSSEGKDADLVRRGVHGSFSLSPWMGKHT